MYRITLFQFEDDTLDMANRRYYETLDDARHAYQIYLLDQVYDCGYGRVRLDKKINGKWRMCLQSVACIL